MTNQTTPTPLNPSTPTTEEEYVYNPFPPAFISDEPMEISGRDMGYLIPWMQAQLKAQTRDHDNSDLCQALSSILRQANKVYGTESETRETCICYG
ncbi:hypothetical protein ACPCSP_25570 [Streptomyces cinereoruber]|uniref:hypothetical protein n=1 Tax=Streptomyces cinereoruber TaxID=67260 RepID=UPI003C2EE06C